MSVALALQRDIALDEDVIARLRSFLFDTRPNGAVPLTHRSRSSSTDSQRSSLDADKPAGVGEWVPFVPQEEDSSETPTSWLGFCLLASYSSMEYLLACNGLRWALVRRKPTDESLFDIIASREVELKAQEDAECYITSCALFGLGSTRQSELIDCVIVAVGTSSGAVIFYTDSGKMLFEETFAVNSPVLALSLDYAEDGHLFSVVTEAEIFAINAFSLHSTLLQCRASIAKGEKTAAELSDTVELECSRIQVDGGTRIIHAAFTGVVKPSAFDQYVSAGIEDFNCRVDRSSLPNYTTFFVHTERLFATFAWLPEGENTNIWTDAVTKIASSFVPHFGIRKFLGIAHKPARKSALSQSRQAAVSRGNINDPRTVMRISKAPPPRPLLAVMDTSARVILIDTRERRIVRIWKAYRDAQVAWITASHQGTTALFLAVFAPRRALLEVWSVPNGTRVGAQHVDPEGMLVDGGAAAVICGKNEADLRAQAYFVDSKCVFHSIDVPFHLALVQGNTKEQHDQLIMQKILTGTIPIDDFLKLYASLKTPSARRQAVLTVLSSQNSPEEMDKLLSHLEKDEGSQTALGDIPQKARKVLSAFQMLSAAMDREEEAGGEEVQIPLGKETAHLIRRHLELGESASDEFPSLHALVSIVDWSSENSKVLEKNLPDSVLLSLCRLLFDPVVSGRLDVDLFVDQVLPRMPCGSDTVASLFLHFFLHDRRKIGGRFSNSLSLLDYFTKKDTEVTRQFEKGAFESRNVSKGILLSTGLWILSLQRAKASRADQTEDDADEFMDANESWEAFDPVVEHHDSAVLAAHAVFLLSELRRDVSYAKMLATGAGFFREQIASWAVEQRLTYEEFCSALLEDENLSELHGLLPKITEMDFLFADVGWECASRWVKSKTDNLVTLQESMAFLQAIKDDRLRHGMAKLMWEKFLLEPVKALSQLMEKTGRGPKEREAKQSLQMHDRHVEPFLEVCICVLEVLLRAVRDQPSIPAIPVDHFLEVALSHPPPSMSSVTGGARDSFAHISSRQSLVNYHLVLHHQHLLRVYVLVIRSGMRIRPLSTVFCSIGQRAMFHPLDSHPLIPLERVDDTTLEHRHRFLSKVAESGSEDDRRLARQLASEWALTMESISLVEALSHFREGNDAQGARDLSSIVSPHLGSKLAKILAARVLRLADAEKTLLTASHMRYLQETAGEEAGRVEWSGDWRMAIESLGGVLRSLSLQPEDTTSLVKISSLTTQYWAISGA